MSGGASSNDSSTDVDSTQKETASLGDYQVGNIVHSVQQLQLSRQLRVGVFNPYPPPFLAN